MTLDTYAAVVNLPLPTVVNHKFCGVVQLAPGYLTEAYVPTAAERKGTYSGFAGLLIDPETGQPFPSSGQDAIIPSVRIPNPFAWRIPPASTQ